MILFWSLSYLLEYIFIFISTQIKDGISILAKNRFLDQYWAFPKGQLLIITISLVHLWYFWDMYSRSCICIYLCSYLYFRFYLVNLLYIFSTAVYHFITNQIKCKLLYNCSCFCTILYINKRIWQLFVKHNN